MKMPQTVALAWLQRTCESSWSFLAVHFPKASLNGSTRPGRRHKVVPCIAAAFLDWKGFKICMVTSNDKHLSIYTCNYMHIGFILQLQVCDCLWVFIIYCNYMLYCKHTFLIFVHYGGVHIYHVYVRKDSINILPFMPHIHKHYMNLI